MSQETDNRLATVTDAYERLRLLVKAMRHAQKNYFKTRDHNDLRISRDYERRVDAELETNPLLPPAPKQESLFGGLTP